MSVMFKIHKDKELKNNIVLYHPFLVDLSKRSFMLWLYLMGFKDESIVAITYKNLENNNMDKNFYINSKNVLLSRGFLIENMAPMEYTYDFYALPNKIKSAKINNNITDWMDIVRKNLNYDRQEDFTGDMILNESDYYNARCNLTSSALDVWFYLAGGHNYNREKLSELTELSERSITRGATELRSKGFLTSDNIFIPNPNNTTKNIKTTIVKNEDIDDDDGIDEDNSIDENDNTNSNVIVNNL